MTGAPFEEDTDRISVIDYVDGDISTSFRAELI